MEQYLDEVILQKREQIKKEKFHSIEDGFFIAGKILHFHQKTIMNSFVIYLPDNMGLMPKELARIKYPSEFRPRVLLTTLDLSTNLGFSLFHRKTQDDEIQKICERMMGAIKREHADYRFFGCQNIPEIRGCQFSFRSHAMDTDLFNMMLVVQVAEQTVLGNFNCLYKDYKPWKELILATWKTIQTIGEEEKAHNERSKNCNSSF